ncbi:MAG: PQQ-dependent sugar dehydrogenase [Planctomycetaceae bacterium]
MNVLRQLRHLIIPVILLAASVSAQDDYQPRIASSSKDAELALQGFQIPEGMKGQLMAAEPMLANPVAFYVSGNGSVYVCETFRQEVGVEDNRSHMNWLDNDLQLQSVEERLAMFRRYLGDDVSKYGVEQDRIRLLRDSNGDGKFDTDSVFAAGFNDPLDGTGAGVIEANGSVYYTCIPKLWRLKDTDSDGIADDHDALHHGYGVRVAFRGHDMHGLTIGPDGRLYYSIGDRGYNVITKEGERLHRPDCGAVFRCDLDGSNLEVFAHGLRNPQELAFDDFGNLFTGDNNSDSGDKARWVYVVKGSDTGWRMYYQYENDRGPWNRERIWYPFRSDEETVAVQPAYILPPVAHLADGPSGLTYYPGIGLPDRYAGHFFMADFRGTAGNSGIRSFAVKTNGATFELVDSHQFIWSILATDVDFAPDGSLYVSDWVNGWVGEGKGRIYRFEHTNRISEVAGAGVPNMLANGLQDAAHSELIGLLAHVDRRVRQQAQFELVRRNADTDLFDLAANAPQPIVRRHAIWGAWQIGLRSAQDSQKATAALTQSIHAAIDRDPADDDLAQCLKVIGDIVDRFGVDAAFSLQTRGQLLLLCRRLTESENLRVAGFAAAALGSVGEDVDGEALLALLDRVNNQDPVVRHQCSHALWQLGQRFPGLLASLNAHPGDAGRLGLVVAMRMQLSPELAGFLSDADTNVVAEAVRAIHDEHIDAAMPALASLAGTPGLPDLVLRRVLNANYRLGQINNASVVAAIAADSANPEAVRLLAARLLKTWNQPLKKDPVTGRWRPLRTDVAGIRNAGSMASAIQPYLPAMLAGSDKLREFAVEIASTHGIKDLIPTLRQLLLDEDNPETLRVSCLRALARLSDNIDELIELGQKDRSESVQLATLELLATRKPKAAIPALRIAIENGSPLAVQRSIRLLGGIKEDEAELILLAAFDRLDSGQLPASSILDLLTAAEQNGSSQLKAAVNSYRKSQKEAGTTLALWSECLEGGEAARGEEIFFGRSAASCRRCHKVNASGGEVGPDLSKIASEKDRTYLLESIVDPNAKIAKGFETVVVVTVEGKVHSGVVKRDDAQVLQLMTPQGALISISPDEIDERTTGQSGMPSDMGKNLIRSEIRDLIAYLATLKGEGAAAHGER